RREDARQSAPPDGADFGRSGSLFTDSSLRAFEDGQGSRTGARFRSLLSRRTRYSSLLSFALRWIVTTQARRDRVRRNRDCGWPLLRDGPRQTLGKNSARLRATDEGDWGTSDRSDCGDQRV